jgi:hypothetical protein
MTPLNDEQLKKVERALTEAHQSRQAPSLGADWTFRVMQDIRREPQDMGHRRWRWGSIGSYGEPPQPPPSWP